MSRNRHARRCVPWLRVRGTFVHPGLTGINRLRFDGRVAGRRLRPVATASARSRGTSPAMPLGRGRPVSRSCAGEAKRGPIGGSAISTTLAGPADARPARAPSRSGAHPRRPIGGQRAQFVGGNFVLVDVRLLGFYIKTRLAWVGLAAGALGFLGGRLWAKADQPHRGGDASGSRHDEGADPT